MIIKFLMFKMPSIIPLVLPLSVLLASIMTFGSLAENYEFAAMKSSGISLQRAMRSLTVFILLLSIVAFFFANNVIPYAEYKFINFRRNIAQVKPAMAIAEGQFSDVGVYSIKVEKKSGENGKYLTGVTIHKKAAVGSGSNTVIKAKKGELISSEDSNTLKLVLNDGNYYEDIIPKKFEDRNKMPFAKSQFQRYVINIDLSKLNNTNLNEESITNTNTMLNVSELAFTLDSLQKNYDKEIKSYSDNINQRVKSPITVKGIASSMPLTKNNILDNFNTSDKIQILRVASGSVDGINFTLESSTYEIKGRIKNINQHWIALYDKFVIAYACLLMFFIGAPLGAIIRKGGLGLPIVFAVMIFIIFHFINTFGKKVAQQDELSAFMGCWMSSFILTPFAILLTKRATEDKGLSIDFEWLTNFFNRIFPDKTQPEPTSPITPELAIKSEEVHQYLNTLPDSKKAVTPTPLETKPVAKVTATTEFSPANYQLFSLTALVANLLLLGLFFFGKPDTILLISTALLLAVVLLYSLYKTHQSLAALGRNKQNNYDIPLIVLLLAGFPFYILFYGYNSLWIKSNKSN
jgi:lipopolysaccharide export system permease protein